MMCVEGVGDGAVVDRHEVGPFGSEELPGDDGPDSVVVVERRELGAWGS